MDKKKKLEKLKQRVEEFRRKHAHTGKEAKGVSKPKHPQKKAPKAVGPRGGVYAPTKTGGKHYSKALVKSKLEEMIKESKYENFIKEIKMKQEDIKKAVTSEAAIQEKQTDEQTINGENKPAIQDAKTLSELQGDAAKPADPVAAAPAPTETTPPAATEPTAAAAPAEPAKKEISFDGMFAPAFSLGSTLKQNPNGGNSLTNIKKPAMDYVERAKNHKNVSMTADQLKGNKK